MADMRERARKFLAELPQCKGYPTCDGDLVATEHEPGCPMFGKPERTSLDVLTAFAESLALPQAGPVCPRCPNCGESAGLYFRPHEEYVYVGCRGGRCLFGEQLKSLADFAQFFPTAAPPGDAETPARIAEALQRIANFAEVAKRTWTAGGNPRIALEDVESTASAALEEIRKASVLNTGAETPWISCAERLPEVSPTPVLVVIYGQVKTAYRYEYYKSEDVKDWAWQVERMTYMGIARSRVTHWQPLPAPPASVREGARQG
jgi:hypothetical protein